jgi:type I restriction enzyme S subunit
MNGQDYKHIESDDGFPVMGSGGRFTYASKFMYDKESVLLGRKGTIDKPLYIHEPFWTVDTMYYTEIEPTACAKFVYYLALTIQFKKFSTNTALPSMTQENLGNYVFAVPRDLPEQTQIAKFLDHETAKIDLLIEKQEALIRLLKEKRQAVISHAVTKGLNPHAPLKDSGIEWLGQVPAHWEVKRLKHVAEVVDCRNKTPEYIENGRYLVVRTTNIKDQQLVLDGAAYTNEFNFRVWTDRGIPPVGSIFFTREAPAGEVCLVPEGIDLCMGQRMMNFICHNGGYTTYLFDFLLSDCLERYIESASHGSTVSHLRVEQVENIPVLVPPNDEISDIHDHLREIKFRFGAINNNAEAGITLLQERRTALISAAVTGKIDVRHWQPPTVSKLETVEPAAR